MLRSYPGLITQNQSNPNGVLSGVRCTGTQPRWGCDSLDSDTQGSSSLATLGWRPESLWDSTNRISAALSEENGDSTQRRKDAKAQRHGGKIPKGLRPSARGCDTSA